MQCRHFWFSVTEEYLNSVGINVYDVCNTYATIKKWAFIKHDKDVYDEYDEFKNSQCKQGIKKPNHYHVYIHFGGQSVDHTLVAKWFKVEPNIIQRIKTTASNCLLYFVHETSEAIARKKYNYSWNEVYSSPGFDVQSEAEVERCIGDFTNFSYREQIEKVHSITDPKARVKAQELLDKCLAHELKFHSQYPERNIRVVFITGGSGTGKTTFARQFVEKANRYDFLPDEVWKKDGVTTKPFKKLTYAVSGSSNDIFQSYAGEDAYILDDMRDTSFQFEDLLKFLDNYVNSPVKVRFANKCFTGLLLIITSSVELKRWYSEIACRKESMRQLYRRICNYIECDKKEIRIYDEIDEFGNPCGDILTIPNNTQDFYKDKPKPVNVGKLMFNMFSEDGFQGKFDKALSTPPSQDNFLKMKK